MSSATGSSSCLVLGSRLGFPVGADGKRPGSDSVQRADADELALVEDVARRQARGRKKTCATTVGISAESTITATSSENFCWPMIPEVSP